MSWLVQFGKGIKPVFIGSPLVSEGLKNAQSRPNTSSRPENYFQTVQTSELYHSLAVSTRLSLLMNAPRLQILVQKVTSSRNCTVLSMWYSFFDRVRVIHPKLSKNCQKRIFVSVMDKKVRYTSSKNDCLLKFRYTSYSLSPLLASLIDLTASYIWPWMNSELDKNDPCAGLLKS